MRRVLLSAAVLALLGASPAAASADCRDAAGPDARVAHQSRLVVVFTRVVRAPHTVPKRVYDGCEREVGKLVRLHSFEDSHYRIHDVAIAGHDVAYSWTEPDGAPMEEVNHIQLHDLRTGGHRTVHHVVALDKTVGDGDEIVRSLVLKPNGSLAWIASYEDVGEPTYEVNVIETGRDNRRTMLDEGAEIGPRSLALSANGARIYWKNAGEVRSAPLR